MSEKPEALRLADECDWSAKFKAAKELRRLHAENERLQERCDELGSDKERWYRMAELHCTTIDQLKDAMRKAMAMLDKHEPEPAGAFAVLLLALNPELQSAKKAALRREET